MATVELTPADVQSYTQGRLSATDPETQRLLSMGLAAVRRYCGWHVTPAVTETMTVDGNGQSDITLPTLYVQSITSITDNGTTVDLGTVEYSNQEPGILHRNDWTFWTCGLGKVVVELEHGFDDAYDFQQAVLEFIDRTAAVKGTAVGASGPLAQKKVDDVDYKWIERVESNPRFFDGLNHTLLDHYRLLPIA